MISYICISLADSVVAGAISGSFGPALRMSSDPLGGLSRKVCSLSVPHRFPLHKVRLSWRLGGKHPSIHQSGWDSQ